MRIARTKRKRSRRRLGRSSAWRVFVAIVAFLLAVGLAVGAYEIGSELRRGRFTLPLTIVRAAITAEFLILVWMFARRASSRFERIDTDLLLTTVPAREVALGVVFYEYSRVAAPFSLPVLGIAFGFAIGVRSLVSAVTILVAVAGFVAFSLLASFALGLGAERAADQLPFIHRYRRVFSVIVYLLPVIVWLAVIRGVVPVDSVIGLFGALPPGWFVDLGLWSVPSTQSGPFRSVGALCLIVLGCPLLALVTTRLAERQWYAELGSSQTTQRPLLPSTSLSRSQPFNDEGISQRLFGDIVSRPALTVAQKTWLYERRVPVGFLSALLIIVYIPLLLGIYVFETGEIPTIAPVLLAFAGAGGTSFAFGVNLLGKEYPVLPMTLTTITGREFVRGIVLAGVAVGAPITTAVTVVIGLLSPLGVIGTVLIAVAGDLLCVCGVTLAAAASMRVSYRDIVKVPLPQFSGNMYSDAGWESFVGPLVALSILGLVFLPMFVSYLPVLSGPVATALGTSTAAIHIVGIVLTAALSVGGSALAYRRAVRLFDQYTIR